MRPVYYQCFLELLFVTVDYFLPKPLAALKCIKIIFLSLLTLSSIYTYSNILKKENTFEKHCGKKVKLPKMSNFTFFPQCFLCNLYLKIL